MHEKIYSYCTKCNNLNIVSTEKIKKNLPICGVCGAPLIIHSYVSEINPNGLTKMTRKISLPIVIDFWAPWCAPCSSFAPTFEKASKLFGGKIVFAKINTQNFPEVSSQFNIRGIPSLLVFVNGKEIARESGAFPFESFRDWLQQFAPATMNKSMEE